MHTVASDAILFFPLFLLRPVPQIYFDDPQLGTTRCGIARDFLGEKPETEILVLDEEIFAANFEALEELRIVPIAAKPQGDLHHSEQEKLQKYQRKAEKPQPPAGGRYLSNSLLSTRRIGFLPSMAQT